MVFLGFIADVQTISVRKHFETKRKLHVLDVAQEELIQVSADENGDCHLYLELLSRLDYTTLWLKLADNAVWIIDILPLEDGW